VPRLQNQTIRIIEPISQMRPSNPITTGNPTVAKLDLRCSDTNKIDCNVARRTDNLLSAAINPEGPRSDRCRATFIAKFSIDKRELEITLPPLIARWERSEKFDRAARSRATHTGSLPELDAMIHT